MMQPNASRLSINLGKAKNNTTTNFLVDWTINAGRIIIVVVELLTLGALGYRFVIDRQIVDIHDLINKEQFFINAQAQKENLYRNVQSRLDSIQSLEAQTQSETTFLKKLLALTNSPDFSATTLEQSQGTITITGNTFSIFSLNKLIEALKEDQGVVSISLDELTSADSGGLRFRLNVLIQGR